MTQAKRANNDLLCGIVVATYGRQIKVLGPNQETVDCLSRKRDLRPIVGDRVRWGRGAVPPQDPTSTSPSVGSGAHKDTPAKTSAGVVHEIVPRKNVFARPMPGRRDRPIAANLDYLVLVIAPIPQTTDQELDRYLVTAEHIGIETLIVFNKDDLTLDDAHLEVSARHETAQVENRIAAYQALGYRTLRTSCETGRGVSELRAALADATSIFVGQSGVGKSSLINKLLPERDITVGALAHKGRYGRHTTSTTTLYALPDGGWIVDSPGVREFGLWRVDAAELDFGYREFRQHASQCRFRDCLHRNEPDCAVLAALKVGEITATRYETYLALLAVLTES